MTVDSWEPDPDEDLSVLLGHLSALKLRTRKRQANDARTRAVLSAAMRLVDAQFSGCRTDATDEEARRYPFFQWLSRRKIATEVANSEVELTDAEREEYRDKIERLMENLWRSHDDFLQDFLTVALRQRHWSLLVSTKPETQEMLLHALLDGDLTTVVQEVAYEDLSIPMAQPGTFRMELMAAALVEREPAFRELLADTYSAVDESWTGIYRSMFETRGWELRPGITFQDVNLMLSTAAEGMALRSMVSSEGLMDHETRTSLLGKMALALLLSCVETGEGLSLEQAATKLR
jgi:hypothetical protein